MQKHRMDERAKGGWTNEQIDRQKKGRVNRDILIKHCASEDVQHNM